jgi:hypothetical protein
MAVRGVYPKALEKMVADTNRRMDMAVGWSRPAAPPVATAAAMKTMAFGVDRWNPLWRDETYAAGTRWGGLIAFPMFQGSLRANMVDTSDTPECGFDYQLWLGQDWEFFRPIYPGDSFKIWNRRPQIKDATGEDGKGPHTFALMEADCDHINQRDELVSTMKTYTYRTFFPDGPPEPANNMPKYGYTQEELEYIDGFVRAEEVRGANIRYWEDVKTGDETKPVVLGPTYMGDNAANFGDPGMMMMALPLRELLHQGPDGKMAGDFLKDPETGLFVVRGGGAGRHWSDLAARAEGEPCAFLFAVLSVYTMLRLLTNWMGNDGFLRKYHWRHIARNPVGDCLIGHGRVTGKRAEHGEHLVDLEVWLENMRGNITEVANATVKLCSREAPYQWK